MSSIPTLRRYQEIFADDVRGAYKQGFRAPLGVLPTGGGKTIVFSYIGHSAVSRQKKVLILVHRIELIRQTYAKLFLFGLNAGVINAKFTPNPYAPIQIASVQTLVKRMNSLPFEPDLIIIDECHHATAGSWRKILDRYPNAKLLGVTATPVRTDGVGLGVDSGGYFDTMVLGPDAGELIDLGYLVSPKVFVPANRIDLSRVDILGGDYNKEQLGQLLDKPTITGDAVREYTKRCPGAPCVVFCVTVEHAKHVADQFAQAGYRATYADGNLDDDERQRRLNGLATTEVQVLTTCDLISEGTDIPEITCAILLRPTQSTGLFLQQVGRALRPSAGKKHAIILDHVGNCLTHGLPTEPRTWSLDGEKRTKKTILAQQQKLNIKQCPNCFNVHEAAPKCPECNYIYVPESRPIQIVEGDLSEITAEQMVAAKQTKRIQIARARTMDELLRIEAEMGYKSGWAKHIYLAKQNKNGFNAGK